MYIYPIPLEMQVSSQELDESTDGNHGGGGHRVHDVEVGDEGDVDLNMVFREKIKKYKGKCQPPCQTGRGTASTPP